MQRWVSGMALAAALAFATGAASAEPRVSVVEAQGLAVTYDNGIKAAVSEQAASEGPVAVLDGRVRRGERPIVGVGVKNKTDKPVNFTPESVRVIDQAGRPLKLLTRDDVVAAAEKAARSNERRQRFLNAAANMGGGSATSTTNGRVYGPQGSAAFTARTETTYQDDLASSIAQTQRSLEHVQDRGAMQVAAASEFGLAGQTVRPGEVYQTELGLDVLPKDVTALTITIDFAGETHVLPLKVETLR